MFSKFLWSKLYYGCQACRSVFVKFLVKFDLEFDLKFEISDGKNLVKFRGRTFLPARKAQKISGRISGQISEQISEKISETSFQISRLFSETSFSRRAVLKTLRPFFGQTCKKKAFFCRSQGARGKRVDMRKR